MPTKRQERKRKMQDPHAKRELTRARRRRAGTGLFQTKQKPNAEHCAGLPTRVWTTLDGGRSPHANDCVPRFARPLRGNRPLPHKRRTTQTQEHRKAQQSRYAPVPTTEPPTRTRSQTASREGALRIDQPTSSSSLQPLQAAAHRSSSPSTEQSRPKGHATPLPLNWVHPRSGNT